MNETTFTRHNSGQNFTVVNNHFLQDQNLSNKAVGLLARILSLPSDWKISYKGLSTTFKCSKDQISTIFKELTKFGYIQITKVKGENNLIKSFHYDISDLPIYLNETPVKPDVRRYPVFQDTEIQDTEIQDTEIQDTEKQDVINTNVISTEIQKTKKLKTKRVNENFDFLNYDKEEIKTELLTNPLLFPKMKPKQPEPEPENTYSEKQQRAQSELLKIGFHQTTTKLIIENVDYLKFWFEWKYNANYNAMNNQHKRNSFNAFLKNNSVKPVL